MAIDTQDKRRSTIAVHPVPNSGIDAGDRQQVVWIYRGIAAAAPVAIGFLIEIGEGIPYLEISILKDDDMDHVPGSAFNVPATIRDTTDPFNNSPALTDPDSVKISVWDPAGTLKVNEQPMTNSATGKWKYLVESGTDWLAGAYKAQITAVKSGKSVKMIDESSFRLVA